MLVVVVRLFTSCRTPYFRAVATCWLYNRPSPTPEITTIARIYCKFVKKKCFLLSRRWLLKFKSPRGTSTEVLGWPPSKRLPQQAHINPHSCTRWTYLPGVGVNHDQEGGSPRVRPVHCTSDRLTPTIVSNVNNSSA